MRITLVGLSIGSGTPSFGGATGGVLWMKNATATSSDPVGGVTIVAHTGFIQLRGASGWALDLAGTPATTTTATAGAGSALPATPEGYLTVRIAGTNRKIPYYAT